MQIMTNEQAMFFFSDYMRITGVPKLGPLPQGEPELIGKTLGIVNGSSWIELWSNFFGKRILPGVKFVNVGNEGVQLNFMQAHHDGKPCPPESNIQAFVRYARELAQFAAPDAILISCSTMNRSFSAVAEAVIEYDIPVIQIDMPMMEQAVAYGGKILVVATHGPTVKSTQNLLTETAQAMQREVSFCGATVEEAFSLLGEGRIAEHNEEIAAAIMDAQKQENISCVVLAQLSMAVFSLSYPNPVDTFGIPVFNSAEAGFGRIRQILLTK